MPVAMRGFGADRFALTLKQVPVTPFGPVSLPAALTSYAPACSASACRFESNSAWGASLANSAGTWLPGLATRKQVRRCLALVHANAPWRLTMSVAVTPRSATSIRRADRVRATVQVAERDGFVRCAA